MISVSTMLHLLAAAPSAAAFDGLVLHTRDSHAQTRRGAVDGLTQLLRSEPGSEAAALVQSVLAAPAPGGKGGGPPPAQALLGVMRAVTADADASVRSSAGKCFWALHALLGRECDALLGNLEPAQQKLLKRCRPA